MASPSNDKNNEVFTEFSDEIKKYYSLTKMRDRLDQLIRNAHLRKDSVKPRIFRKVVNDYKEQRSGVVGQWRSLGETLIKDLNSFQSNCVEYESKLESLDDELEELKFRVLVGEYRPEEVSTRERGLEGKVAEFKMKHGVVVRKIKYYVKIQQDIRSYSGDEVEIEPVESGLTKGNGSQEVEEAALMPEASPVEELPGVGMEDVFKEESFGGRQEAEPGAAESGAEFNLDELETPSVEPEGVTESRSDSETAEVEFNLDDLEAPPVATEGDGEDFDFDQIEFELKEEIEPELGASVEIPKVESAVEPVEKLDANTDDEDISLDNFEWDESDLDISKDLLEENDQGEAASGKTDMPEGMKEVDLRIDGEPETGEDLEFEIIEEFDEDNLLTASDVKGD